MKPNRGFVKVNTAGAFDTILKGAVVGVIARDSSGFVLGGHSMPLAYYPDPASAEALAILQDLILLSIMVGLMSSLI